jgi:hypothetical protein
LASDRSRIGSAGPTTGLAAIDSQHRCSGRLREERSRPAAIPWERPRDMRCAPASRPRHFLDIQAAKFPGTKTSFYWGARIRPAHKAQMPVCSALPDGLGTWGMRDCYVVARRGSNLMAGFDTPSDGTACTSGRQCPVCRGPMQVVGVESGVPGLRPDLRRQMIKCSACELVAVHTFALEQER